MVGNHKGVHPVVFWQVRIGFLELFDLFRIEDMDFPPEPAQTAIFTKSIDQIVPVDGGSLQANHHITEPHRAECRHDSL